MPRRNRCCQPAELISTDPANALALGGDGNLFVPEGGGGVGYLSYVAVLRQNGETPPVPTVMVNEIGAMVWSRDNVGVYRVASAGLFTINKTVAFVSILADAGFGGTHISDEDDTRVLIYTSDRFGSLADTILTGSSFEIRVYPT